MEAQRTRRKIPPIRVHRPGIYDWGSLKPNTPDCIEGDVKLYRNLASASYTYGKRHGMKFTVRKFIDEQGRERVGVWRIE
ncbi:MAG: hypothetical protein MUE60_15930 [Candidatus Eisenbacteria bacterium]|nr:hypothetical protein [Candidatus Eisenbacteria bacterium]